MIGMFGARCFSRFAISGAFDGEIAIAATPFVEQVVDDLNFAGLVGARCRAGIEAGVAGARQFRIRLLAAQMDLLEERVVEPFTTMARILSSADAAVGDRQGGRGKQS